MNASISARARLSVVLITSLLVAGCGSGGTANVSTDESGSSGATTETFAEPTLEPTEPTTPPVTTAAGSPTISLANLPIGGNTFTDEDDPRRQCVGIDWIVTTEAAPEIRPGYVVAVTGAVFDAPGFEVDPDGCAPDTGSGRPSCVGHVLRTDDDACDLGVRALPDADPEVVVRVGLAGVLTCPADTAAEACERFAAAVDAEPGVTIELDPPPRPTSPPVTESPVTESPTTESPTTGSSDPSTESPTTEGGSPSGSQPSGEPDPPTGPGEPAAAEVEDTWAGTAP